MTDEQLCDAFVSALAKTAPAPGQAGLATVEDMRELLADVRVLADGDDELVARTAELSARVDELEDMGRLVEEVGDDVG